MISHETEIKMAKLHVEIGKGNKGLHLAYFNFDFLIETLLTFREFH